MKCAVFSPDSPTESVVEKRKRHLFKLSDRKYPDQFWAEIVAYRIGCLLGVEVPPYFVAHNSQTGESGALSEWFYTDRVDEFQAAGDILVKDKPFFERKKGSDHNLEDNARILNQMVRGNPVAVNWKQWWVDALLFDTLIGNTDRHQDNWGIIRSAGSWRLCPLFDNGTSLGHERQTKRVEGWDTNSLERYINKGTHHVKWSLASITPPYNHFGLVQRALEEWPETRDTVWSRLDFSAEEMRAGLIDILKLELPVPLSAARFEFMLRLLERRLDKLKNLFR